MKIHFWNGTIVLFLCLLCGAVFSAELASPPKKNKGTLQKRTYRLKQNYPAPKPVDPVTLGARPAASRPKNIILVIGDGMGPGALRLASLHAHGRPGRLLMEQLPAVGLVRTASANRDVTDSAAAGTALSSGIKTDNRMIGMTPSRTICRSIAEAAACSGRAGGVEDDGLVDRLAARALVEQAQRVAHAAVGQAREHIGRAGRELDIFPLRDVFQPAGDDIRVQPVEVEALAAGEYGRRHLPELGGGEDEHEVLRRLLENLEQRVEGRAREHMHLVDDVDAHLHARGGEDRLVAQCADIVDAVVARGVYLDDVHIRAVLDGAAGGALVARAAVNGMLAVDGAGEQLRAGGLARAARPDEEIGVAYAPRLDLTPQGIRHLLLAPDVVERPRAVFAVQRLIRRAHPP